jgi:hypothetical protein
MAARTLVGVHERVGRMPVLLTSGKAALALRIPAGESEHPEQRQRDRNDRDRTRQRGQTGQRQIDDRPLHCAGQQRDNGQSAEQDEGAGLNTFTLRARLSASRSGSTAETSAPAARLVGTPTAHSMATNARNGAKASKIPLSILPCDFVSEKNVYISVGKILTRPGNRVNIFLQWKHLHLT